MSLYCEIKCPLCGKEYFAEVCCIKVKYQVCADCVYKSKIEENNKFNEKHLNENVGEIDYETFYNTKT
jgi:hypothetical protein